MSNVHVFNHLTDSFKHLICLVLVILNKLDERTNLIGLNINNFDKIFVSLLRNNLDHFRSTPFIIGAANIVQKEDPLRGLAFNQRAFP